MAKVTLKIEGIRDCEAALDELSNATARNVIQRALTQSAAPLVSEAKSRVARRTGKTAEDIQVGTQLTKRQRKGRLKQTGVEVYAGVGGKRRGPIVHLLEFGSARQAPEPFMRPAWDSTIGAVLNNFKDALKAEIEKAKARAARKAAKAAKGA